MLKKILAYFDEQNWEYDLPEPSEELVLLGVSTENDNEFQCLIHVNETAKNAVFFSIFPNNVPEKRRTLLAVLLLKINYLLLLGSFEMDFDDGQIRFKISYVFEDMELSVKTIEYIVSNVIIEMDTHFQIIQHFIEKKMTSKEISEMLSKIK